MTARTKTPPVRRRRASRGSGEQLHAEIVAAAKQLLAAAADADAVSIRAVADAVGVTPPSIYLHFADKDDMISAVVVDVFAELDAAMLAASEGIESPLERLRVYGHAYVRFAVDHPEHYRIATMDACPKPDSGVDEVLATSAFAHFNTTVLDCMAAGIFTERDPLPVTLDLWAAAHGIAALLIAKPNLSWGSVEEATERVLRAAAVGHACVDLVSAELDDAVTADVFVTWLTRQQRGVVPVGSGSGEVGNQPVAGKAEEEDGCSRATADDDKAARRRLNPAAPGRTSGRGH